MDFAFIKTFKMSLEIECLSEECCSDKLAGRGKIFKIDIERKNIQGFGLGLADTFDIDIDENNNCCYSPSLSMPNVKCPYCNKEYNIYLIKGE